MNCPCQSGESYESCCARFITHQATPENALQLMRSRYTAYVLKQGDYLKYTWLDRYSPPDLDFQQDIKWLGLDIIEYSPQGESAIVEFEARFLESGRVQGLHERSRFVRENGRWFYTDGDMMDPLIVSSKPSRNQACPCGSGKKFKRCCAA